MKTSLIILAFAAASFGLAGSASALQDDLYVIIEGPNAGVGIVATAGTNVVPQNLNPTTNAQGTISPAKAGCSGSHFHGSLFGAPDTNMSGCGKGRVAAVAAGPSVGRSVSDAVTLEFAAIQNLCNAPQAIMDLDAAMMAIDMAIMQAQGNSSLSKAVKKLEKAKQRDQEARDALDMLVNNPPEGGIAQEVLRGMAGDDIEKAIKDKQKAVSTLVKEGILQ